MGGTLADPKGKQTKNLEQANPKTTWRAHSPQHKENNDNMQQETDITSIISSIPTDNIYSDLELQEQLV